MKKAVLLITFLCFFISTVNVNAEVVVELNYPKITTAEYEDGKFKIEGTGTGQIQVVLFDLNNNPLYMTTVLATEGEYSVTLPAIEGIKEGNYKAKVADYNGENVNTKIINVKLSSTPIINENNPQTGDNIISSIIISGLSILGIIGCMIYFKKKNDIVRNNKNNSLFN